MSHASNHAEVALIIASDGPAANTNGLEDTLLEYFHAHGIRRVAITENNTVSAEVAIIALNAELQTFVAEDFFEKPIRDAAHGALSDVPTDHLDYPARMLYLVGEKSQSNAAFVMSIKTPRTRLIPLDIMYPQLDPRSRLRLTETLEPNAEHTTKYQRLEDGPDPLAAAHQRRLNVLFPDRVKRVIY